jgi:hypothetical protein
LYVIIKNQRRRVLKGNFAAAVGKQAAPKAAYNNKEAVRIAIKLAAREIMYI